MNKRRFALSVLCLPFLVLFGCTIGMPSEEVLSSSTSPVVTSATVSGTVIFPASVGTTASIRTKVSFDKYDLFINGKKSILNSDGSFLQEVPRDDNDQYDIQVKFKGNTNAVMRAFATVETATDKEKVKVFLDVKTTAHALAYVSYKSQIGKTKTTYNAFTTLLAQSHSVITEISKRVEDRLKSSGIVESKTYMLEDDSEIQTKLKESKTEAKKNESKLITICHIPPGNPDNQHTITISENAWKIHEGHGDKQGICSADSSSSTTTSSTSSSSSSSTSTTTTTSTTTSTGNNGTICLWDKANFDSCKWE